MLSVEPENVIQADTVEENPVVSEETPEPLSVQGFMMPGEVYRQQRKQEKTKAVLRIVSLLLVEAILLGLGFWGVRHYDLQNRSLRQLQKQLTGQISLRTGTYTGETDFGWFDGTGNFAFRSGCDYSGEWKDNRFNGKGELKTPTEGVYEGGYLDGKRNGVGGVLNDCGSDCQFVLEWLTILRCIRTTSLTARSIA